MDAKTKLRVLQNIGFGKRVAEEEVDELETYFVQTDFWRRIYSGDVDIVYGPKGSGKSAIYLLIQKSATELFDRNIRLVAGEEMRGEPAFAGLN